MAVRFSRAKLVPSDRNADTAVSLLLFISFCLYVSLSRHDKGNGWGSSSSGGYLGWDTNCDVPSRVSTQCESERDEFGDVWITYAPFEQTVRRTTLRRWVMHSWPIPYQLDKLTLSHTGIRSDNVDFCTKVLLL